METRPFEPSNKVSAHICPNKGDRGHILGSNNLDPQKHVLEMDYCRESFFYVYFEGPTKQVPFPTAQIRAPFFSCRCDGWNGFGTGFPQS